MTEKNDVRNLFTNSLMQVLKRKDQSVALSRLRNSCLFYMLQHFNAFENVRTFKQFFPN